MFQRLAQAVESLILREGGRREQAAKPWVALVSPACGTTPGGLGAGDNHIGEVTREQLGGLGTRRVQRQLGAALGPSVTLKQIFALKNVTKSNLGASPGSAARWDHPKKGTAGTDTPVTVPSPPVPGTNRGHVVVTLVENCQFCSSQHK